LLRKINHIIRDSNKWSVLTLTIVCFIAVPIFTIVFKLFKGPGESWGHLKNTVLADYVSNSLFLLLGTSILTLFFGVTSAWIVSRYEFKFRVQIEWLLILPLAIPSYITAYAYAGVFDYGGVWEKITFGIFPKLDIMNLNGLIWILSISLYPYVYLATRAFFLNQSGRLFEASKLLGVGELKTLRKLILPLARPAIIGGLILVMMEVLNDYGAAKYFGVSTFTTGIFRAWFSLEEPETAIYLSALLVTIIFVLLGFERWQRRKIRYSVASKTQVPLYRHIPKGNYYVLLYLLISIPIFFGFLLPIIQLFNWALLTYKEVVNDGFIVVVFQSFVISLLSSISTVLFALSLIYFTRFNRLRFLDLLTKLGTLGYAIPGAVIAIGVLVPTLGIDKYIANYFLNTYNLKVGLFINGTILALLYAYIVRFMAVAHNPIDAVSLKVNKSTRESSKMLGNGNIKTFLKVEFPLIKTGIYSAIVLVFVDVMKELPLTLILKPYKIQTLAVQAYEYASDEQIMEASLPALLLIFTGILPIILLNNLINK
jgi:iron(III) transport system permease protein